jgi:hypothetical protein
MQALGVLLYHMAYGVTPFEFAARLGLLLLMLLIVLS